MAAARWNASDSANRTPRKAGVRAGVLWWAVVVALVVAVGVSVGGPTVASAALDMALVRALDAERVRVEVTAWPPAALWWGRVDVLTVAARNLRVGTLRVQSLDATLDRVQMDAGALYAERQVSIRSLGSAVARFTVAQDALQSMLGAQPSVRDAVVTLHPGRISLAATVGVLGMSLQAVGTGRLVLRGEHAADLALDRVTVAGVPVPSAIVAQLIGGLNPVLDVGALPFGLHLTGVTVGEGEVIVDAAAGTR
ncbi:MAG TPA: DUF2993 domain-containing protein [bacterium]|nr:DUF2993 domain-containing protein [bacterium]